ncbi:MAG: ACT domain-containing protein [Deltaproteobacteria bacterium]|nr:ACT domain-containing protein [Deltaproteobacteria bacterium]
MISSQLSIKTENKPGTLARLTNILTKERISIRATTITTAGSFGIVNLIVDNPRKAFFAIEKEGMEVNIKDVLAVLIDDEPGGLNKLTNLLFENGININDAYGFVLESHKNAVFVVAVDSIKKAEALLEKNGFTTLDAEALATIEPFHYSGY